MPLIDSSLQSVWESLYGGGFVRARKEFILGCNGLPFGQGDHFRLKAALNLQPGQSIALVGAGFGWVAEDWFASGLSPIVALDTSTWIQNNKAANASVTIHNEDGLSNASRGRIRNALGLSGNNKATWAISEDVLPCLTDAECVALDSAMRQYATNVAHWVTVGTRVYNDPNIWAGDSRLNWKTLEGWKALVGTSLVVQRGLDRVL